MNKLIKWKEWLVKTPPKHKRTDPPKKNQRSGYFHQMVKDLLKYIKI